MGKAIKHAHQPHSTHQASNEPQTPEFEFQSPKSREIESSTDIELIFH